MKSIFNKQDYKALVARVNKLTPESNRQWGTMDVAQMLKHCYEVQLVMNGQKPFKANFFAKLFKGVIRKGVFNKRAYNKNLLTAPQYKVTTDEEFEANKKLFLESLKFMHTMSEDQANSLEHSLFGKMTKQEAGWGAYKHHDHHLRQFGV